MEKICETCNGPFMPKRPTDKGRFCSQVCYLRKGIKEPRFSAEALRERQIKAFWSKVDRTSGPSECWPWTGGTDKDGYGKTSFGPYNDKNYRTRAHRLAWVLTHGEIDPGLCVLHHCDNPPCCNPDPDHLFLGTIRDNNDDKEFKGRGGHTLAYSGDHWAQRYPERVRRGSLVPASKLNEEDIPNIRKMAASGRYALVEIGRIFGVTEMTIHSIVKNRTWKHVKGC